MSAVPKRAVHHWLPRQAHQRSSPPLIPAIKVAVWRPVPSARVASNADRIRLVCDTLVANIDIVIACNTVACPRTQSDIEVAGSVIRERVRTDGRVGATGIVKDKRIGTHGCVEAADSVGIQRNGTVGRVRRPVVSAIRVAKERLKTDRGIIKPRRETGESIFALSSVEVTRIASRLGAGRTARAAGENANQASASAIRIKAEAERGRGTRARLFVARQFGIWIGVFMSIIAFYLVVPFWVVVLPFAIGSRKLGTKFLKMFRND